MENRFGIATVHLAFIALAGAAAAFFAFIAAMVVRWASGEQTCKLRTFT